MALFYCNNWCSSVITKVYLYLFSVDEKSKSKSAQSVLGEIFKEGGL